MDIPGSVADLSAILERTHRVPARLAAGVRCVALDAGYARLVMDTPSWLVDPDGSIPLGALGVIVDSTIGTAVMSAVPTDLAIVTSHLHIEALRPLHTTMGQLTCVGRPTAIDERFGLGAADVMSADGEVVARASMGSVIFPVTGAHPLADLTPMDAEGLDMEVTGVDGTGVTTRTPAHAWLANNYGGVHGGAGFLIGERTLQLAIDAADVVHDGRTMRAVELRAAFLRPVPADGRLIDSVGTVVHRGRRLGAARGEVRAPGGLPALAVDATYVPR